jgi:hypothetical protein
MLDGRRVARIEGNEVWLSLGGGLEAGPYPAERYSYSRADEEGSPLMGKYKHTSRTKIVRGIEIPYPTKMLHGVVVIEGGTAFVPLDLLDELGYADNSWGMGDGYLIHDAKIQWALEVQGLIHIETRGGVYTDNEQRKRIFEILVEAHREPHEEAERD